MNLGDIAALIALYKFAEETEITKKIGGIKVTATKAEIEKRLDSGLGL